MSQIFKAPVLVPAGGYKWVKGVTVGKKRPGVYLTNGIPKGAPFKGRTYSVESNPVLFRQFAELDPDPAKIRLFANQWGSFDSKASELIRIAGQKSVYFGTRAEAWRGEIRLMQKTIKTLETANSGKAAKSAIEIINKRINLLSRPRIQLNADKSALKLMLQASGLLGVIWSQLVRFVDERRIHLRCAHCTQWFEVQTHKRGMAKHQKFCSKNCATNASRARKRNK
ncbi:MAG: hypothetical protein VW802_02785 [Rhodospirillaceae bacterium]|jgi:hypothetical protein